MRWKIFYPILQFTYESKSERIIEIAHLPKLSTFGGVSRKVKELLKSVHICQSYRTNKSGTFLWPLCIYSCSLMSQAAWSRDVCIACSCQLPAALGLAAIAWESPKATCTYDHAHGRTCTRVDLRASTRVHVRSVNEA